MQQDIPIISVLFPAILLMMINFSDRYSVLANLIRHLHGAGIRDRVSPKDAERFLLQISRLCDRLRLVGTIQSCAAISFMLAQGAIITIYFIEQIIASILFFRINPAFMWSMLLSTHKIRITNMALNNRLSDLEKYQEWEQYLKPQNRRRVGTRT